MVKLLLTDTSKKRESPFPDSERVLMKVVRSRSPMHLRLYDFCNSYLIFYNIIIISYEIPLCSFWVLLLLKILKLHS